MRRIAGVAIACCFATYSFASSSFTTLYVGVDGPPIPRTYRFDSASAVRASWISAALPRDIDRVLSKVDFSREVLLAAAVGERRNVNTPVHVERVDELVTYVLVGVNVPGCKRRSAASYPFVLIAISRPKSPLALPGYDHQNYGNGCAAALSGSPHGDGKALRHSAKGLSKTTAVIIQGGDVTGIHSEYSWIAEHYPGAKATRQALTAWDAAKRYDIITIKTRQGDKLDLWFDITSMFK